MNCLANNGSFYSAMAAYNESKNSSSEASSRCGIGSNDSSSNLLQIIVKRVGNEDNALTLKVHASASVLDLKNLIYEGLAAKNDIVPVARQRLIYSGRLLMDDDEVLGGKGFKMQTSAVNYVHLSPLPEGAKPSKRPSRRRSTNPLEVQLEGSTASLLRARRLGARNRERRRRRRREEPYSTDSRHEEASPIADERQQTAPPTSEQQPNMSFSGVGEHIQPPSITSQILDIALGRATTPLLQSLLPITPLSPLAQVSQVSAALASSQDLQQDLTAALRSALLERIRHASNDLVPVLANLHAQLHRIGESTGLDVMEESEVREILGSLDRISQESGSLAGALRTMYRPMSIAVSAPLPSHLILEQWLMESLSNRTSVLPGGGPVLRPGAWLTHMF